MHWQSVSSLVGSHKTRSLVALPQDQGQCEEVLAYCRRNQLNICPRGSGRSYGDAILNDRNVLLDMSCMNRILHLDEDRAIITVEAGVRIVDVFARIHELGFTVPASPTDSTISVGGALAANVNGKESWRVGNFGDQVLQVKFLTAAGEVLTLDRDDNKELFHAVIGGMGLLGLIVEVTLGLLPVPSPYLEVSINPAENIDALIRQLDVQKETADFIVVWIDGYASGNKVGRSVIHATKWIESSVPRETIREDVARGVSLLATQKDRAVAFYKTTRHLINLGFHLQRIPFFLFNKFYYWLACRNPGIQKFSNRQLFLEHNFDKSYVIPPPDILCGPHGFTIQITVPFENGREGMSEMLELCSHAPCPPATTILRLHRKDDHLISFSEDGYSLNVEFHPKKRHHKRMQEFLRELMECGVRYGSKVHLPKDHTLTKDQFQRLFPNYAEFLRIKSEIDPEGLFQSDMYRRLFRLT